MALYRFFFVLKNAYTEEKSAFSLFNLSFHIEKTNRMSQNREGGRRNRKICTPTRVLPLSKIILLLHCTEQQEKFFFAMAPCLYHLVSPSVSSTLPVYIFSYILSYRTKYYENIVRILSLPFIRVYYYRCAIVAFFSQKSYSSRSLLYSGTYFWKYASD